MDENKNTEQLTHDVETRSEEIARIAARLPAQEQDKIYYMLKGIEIAGSTKPNATMAAAQ